MCLTYPEIRNIKLEEALPFDAEIDLEGCDKALKKLMGKRVLYHYDGCDYPWPGTHKNVMTWWALEDGYAVGWNESPSIGWSFPSLKLTKANQKKIGKQLPHLG